MKFDEAIQHVLKEEGGYSDDPDDDGNWTGGKKGVGKLKGTKYGISAASYPNLDIKNLTRDQAIQIYWSDYWNKNKVESLPAGIRLHFFDVCVNSGASRAIKILQRAVGVSADGIMGPVTRKALSRVDLWKYARERSDFYVAYAIKNPVKLKYLSGWNGRVLEITKLSL